ncbi:MAG: efflux RND transporter periplasmic adaptor subunit [Devosia sp.]|nr:efflux RND transporter periplasmic adaptor subunit [Devosia sp.]
MKTLRMTALVLGALGLAGCGPIDKTENASPAVRPVLYVVAEPLPEASEGFAGQIVPRVSTSLGFRMLGQLTARDVAIGDVVEAGAVLATLDATQLQQAHDVAVAQLAGAEAQLANAQASEQRLAALLEQGNLAQANYDMARQALDFAEANAESARANLVKAEERLGYARITAEFGGIVTQVGAEVGQTVAAGQPIVSLARTSEREAVIDVPVDFAGGIGVGTVFDVALQALPSVKGEGVVREAAPFADPLTRTIRLRLTLSDPPDAFRLGSTVTATARDGGDAQIRLPLTALREGKEAPAVWIADPQTGTVDLRPVTVVQRGPDWFSPGAEIQPGALVVVAGVHSLEPGQAVRLSEGEEK